MLPFVLLLFILVPLAELAVILQVGSWLGVWPTLAVLVADSVLGAVLLRSQGRAAWRRFQETLGRGRPPAKEVLDGVVIVFGGALLLTPGFLTDLLGLACLLPPTRAVLRRHLVRRFAHRMVTGGVRTWAPRRPDPRREGAGRHWDVEGTATDVDPPRLP